VVKERGSYVYRKLSVKLSYTVEQHEPLHLSCLKNEGSVRRWNESLYQFHILLYASFVNNLCTTREDSNSRLNRSYSIGSVDR
jgi:hypothetical protein